VFGFVFSGYNQYHYEIPRNITTMHKQSGTPKLNVLNIVIGLYGNNNNNNKSNFYSAVVSYDTEGV